MSEPFKFAKFMALYEQLPKDPEAWTMDDVIVWLRLIGMDSYSDNFFDMKIDGLIILDLNEAELEQELKITTKLHKKKMTKAIEVLKEYHQLWKEGEIQGNVQTSLSSTVGPSTTNKAGLKNPQISKDELTKGQENKGRGNRDEVLFGNSPNSKAFAPQPNPQLPDQRQNFEQHDNRVFSMAVSRGGLNNQLQPANPKETNRTGAPANPIRSVAPPTITINSIEGNDQLMHSITETGAKIGRHSSNQIVIYDESVSRHHAEIFYNPQVGRFFLTDVSSTTGTFIKIVDPIELAVDNIIEIGSYQLIVNSIHVATGCPSEDIASNSYVEFSIYESPEELDEKIFCLSHMNSIGRKTTNNLCFSDDLHMSNLHCKINFVGNKFYFEDMASTNGSWLRLSKENFPSQPYMLTNKMIFKIGNSAMYEVCYPNEETKEETTEVSMRGQGNYETTCSICLDAERDCLLMPCRHNVSCTRCIKSVKNCPVCRTPINDIIRIYKA